MSKKRKIIDLMFNVVTYLFSSIGIIVLCLIFFYIFSTGFSTLSGDLLVSDYNRTTYSLKYEDTYLGGNFSYQCEDEEYFSSNWGIAFKNTIDIEGNEAVEITYVDINSPLYNSLIDSDGNYHIFEAGEYITAATLKTDVGTISQASARKGAQSCAEAFNNGNKIISFYTYRGGGGIRGSLISTCYLILFTIIIVLPLGIASAVYLSVYAKDNIITHALKTLIDMSSGVPSIIFGLVGLMIFTPLLDNIIASDGLSIIAGAFTMTIMLLPIVISTAKESIDVIPKSIINGSLALGASQTQTTFKIILPNAIPGILSATLLAIGRIVGESAALIFVMGTQVQDDIALNKGATTLATHIYNLMGLESPNYQLACAIAIVILIAVLILNLLVKLIGIKLNRFKGEK